jgi:hypothetical protein
MKSPFKKPPPDSIGNINGRMAQLRSEAHNAAWDSPASDDPKKGNERYTLPKDYDKRLAAALKKLEPEFKKLEQRLKKCPKPSQTPAKPKPKRAQAKSSAPKATTKPVVATERPKGVLASVLDGDDSGAPMSREGALTEGVKAAPSNNLLDFMQSKLD